MAKPGRKLDRKRTNRRQKHELDYRAKAWRCSKLAVVLADLVADGTPRNRNPPLTAAAWVEVAKAVVRRANREAKRK